MAAGGGLLPADVGPEFLTPRPLPPSVVRPSVGLIGRLRIVLSRESVEGRQQLIAGCVAQWSTKRKAHESTIAATAAASLTHIQRLVRAET